MPTLAERFPELFVTIARDSDGRAIDDPKVHGALLSTGPRVPSPVEVIRFIGSTHNTIIDAPTAIDIANSLTELDKAPAPEPERVQTSDPYTETGPGETAPEPWQPKPGWQKKRKK